eukprot:Gb_15147 [translate_table: standard]
MASSADRTCDLNKRAQGDPLSLLAYLDCSKEKDSKADCDSSGRNLGLGQHEEQCVELPATKVDLDAIRKASSAKSRLRLTSDKVAGRKELKEQLEEATSHCDVQRNMEHAKKKRFVTPKQETAVNAISRPTRKSDDIGKWGSQNENT